MQKYSLEVIRHSMAHLMAHAVQLLYPEEKIQFGIGPVIDSGFYYDIDMDTRLSDHDLKKIEDQMLKLIKQKIPVKRIVMKKVEALEFFNRLGQELKVELINDLPDNQEISCYQQGEFTDLCRGPHVENTGELPRSFKLLHTAGAYWKGDSDRKMLQRIYATCFPDRPQLKKHLHFLEEAKKRDHRKLGKELELFHFEEFAPGSPFFMPKGAFVYNELIDFIRRIYKKFDYQEVVTPQILEAHLWQKSGHYDNYKENMYFTEVDEKEYAIKPMNCPAHMLLYKHYKFSYRDLPMRLADFGRIHRYEKSGTLGGLTRVRTFCQDDAHIFLPIDNIQKEIISLIEMFTLIYNHFDFKDIKINLSTRPDKKVGADETWDLAEEALKKALDASGAKYRIKEGEGAFYGPKIDMDVADALNRHHQLGTIQLDFQLNERFDLKFTNHKGELERPVIIHRALLGSLERFFALYLEHTGGAFPFWIAPVQAVIVPVNNERHLDFAGQLEKRLRQMDFRVKTDDRNESMGFKTRVIQKSKIPFMIVIGDREMENNSVSVRKYGEKNSESIPTGDLIAKFKELDKEKLPAKLRS